MQLSYNRYGVISVQIGYQVRPMRQIKLTERLLTASITHFFSIKKIEEDLNNK
jgi:ribosomal protein S7